MNISDLTVLQGQTFSQSFAITGSDSLAANLSGYAVSGYLKSQYGNTGKLLALGVSVPTPVSGIISIAMSSAETAALPVNFAFYDIEAINSGDGSALKLIGGKVIVYPEVTY